MLLIHKSQSTKKLFFLVITSICGIGALLGLSALTYTPELSHAETVVVPEISHPNLYDITYMQDMTRQVCANSREDDTKQLIDSRDQKSYWVAKMKDGNCWMTQNLALDLDVTKNLTSSDSDVLQDWTPPANTQRIAVSSFADPNDRSLSYDPGEYIYSTPTERHSCGRENVVAVSSCPKWVHVSGLSKDLTGDSRAHYLAGNYYSYDVATAGYTMDSGTATTSICPKNWKLPKSGLNNFGSEDASIINRNGTFAYLFESYGWKWNNSTVGYVDINVNGAIENNDYNAVGWPFYFVYGGSVSYASLDLVGSSGEYTSSVTQPNTTPPVAYGLGVSSVIYPATFQRRYEGKSVRCMVFGGVSGVVDRNVQISVTPTISLEVASEITIERTETNPSTANLDVKVTSNQKYSVGISAVNPDLISSTSNVTIPTKFGLLNTAENGWGIKLKDDTNYTALTTSLQTFYTASGAEIKTIPFTIGISTAPDLPNGEYSTGITVTATQN